MVIPSVKPAYNGTTRDRLFSAAERFRLMQALQLWVIGKVKYSVVPSFRLRQVSLYWVILGSECLTVMNVNITFRDLTPCYLVDNCQRLGLPVRSVFMIVTVCCHHVTREALDWFWWNALCWRSLLPNRIVIDTWILWQVYYSSDVLGELFFEHHRITEHEKDYCNSGIRTENKSSTVRYGLFWVL